MPKAYARFAPGFQEFKNLNDYRRFRGVLVDHGMVTRCDQAYPATGPKPTWSCDHEHKKAIEALECGWQERARRQVSDHDPVAWDPQIPVGAI